MTTTAKALDRLEAYYRERKAEIRRDSSLSLEKRELKIHELGLEYDQRHKRSRGEGVAVSA